MFLICANILLYEKALSNMVRLMGSFPWGPLLNQHPKLVACKKLATAKKLAIIVASHSQ
jgi:hypothetical protein